MFATWNVRAVAVRSRGLVTFLSIRKFTANSFESILNFVITPTSVFSINRTQKNLLTILWIIQVMKVEIRN